LRSRVVHSAVQELSNAWTSTTQAPGPPVKSVTVHLSTQGNMESG